MVGPIEKSIANISTTDVENYKINSATTKKNGFFTKKIANKSIQFLLKRGIECTIVCTAAIMKSTLDSQRQKTSIPTVEDIGDLIKQKKYQDAEKK